MAKQNEKNIIKFYIIKMIVDMQNIEHIFSINDEWGQQKIIPEQFTYL